MLMVINCCNPFHINRSAQPVPGYIITELDGGIPPFLKADSGPYGENTCLQKEQWGSSIAD